MLSVLLIFRFGSRRGRVLDHQVLIQLVSVSDQVSIMLSTHEKRKIVKTFDAAEAKGISIDEIRPVIRDLYIAFHDMWEYVEANNYRVLFARYFKMKKKNQDKGDITKSTEKVPISLVDDDFGNASFLKFNYIPKSMIYQNAKMDLSLSSIADEECCEDCSGDCLTAAFPCACAQETGGVFAYTPEGVLKDEFLRKAISVKRDPDTQPRVFCEDCPIERSNNEHMPEKCKGHVIRKFIKECWRKCGCDTRCGNRVVQRGISRKMQVFWTPQGKGWGVRTLEALEKGSFVCEYVGEIMTNNELDKRNRESTGSARHTYPVLLDADWRTEQALNDDEALCLDATFHGNVARFINHRCIDANLVDVPVLVENSYRRYYHVAFFTTRRVNAFEELTWDYGIEFDDEEHPIQAFQCTCGSSFCQAPANGK